MERVLTFILRNNTFESPLNIRVSKRFSQVNKGQKYLVSCVLYINSCEHLKKYRCTTDFCDNLDDTFMFTFYFIQAIVELIVRP